MWTLTGKFHATDSFFQMHGNGGIKINSFSPSGAIICLSDGTFCSSGDNSFQFETWSKSVEEERVKDTSLLNSI